MQTKMKTAKRYFNIGEEAWYIPGHAEDHLIAIKVKIVEIDDMGDYWIDEPVGHGLDWWELLTKEQAEIELKQRTIDYMAARCMDSLINYESAKTYRPTLERFRERTKKFIAKSWEKSGEKHPGFEAFPNKRPHYDWFFYLINDEIVSKRFKTIKELGK